MPVSRSSSGRRRRGRCPPTSPSAVHPDAEYGRRENGEWVAVELNPDDTFVERKRGVDLVGWRYQGPFDDLPPGSQVEHRVIPWDDVTMDQGTGLVHIATGCGGEDFELGKLHDLPVLTPVDEAGRFYDDYGWLHGLSTADAADQIVGRPRREGPAGRGRPVHACLPALLALRHAAHLPDRRRLVHRRRRDQAEAARGEREGRVGARVHGQAHGRLAAQHGRLEHLPPPLLRPAAAVLPVRVRAPDRDRLEGRTDGAGDRRDRAARGAAAAMDRPRADQLRVVWRARRACPRGRRRLARRGDRPAGDARLGEPGADPRGATARAPHTG